MYLRENPVIMVSVYAAFDSNRLGKAGATCKK